MVDESKLASEITTDAVDFSFGELLSDCLETLLVGVPLRAVI
jgi:hypothetical protein